MAKLTEKQKRFGDYYIELGNKYQAAIKAGYSENYAKGNCVKLFENESVKNYIDERLKQLEDERIASAAEVMKYLTSVMRNEFTEEVVVVEGEGEGISTARKVQKDVSVKDRNKAAELLAKRYGILTENINFKDITPVVIGGANELED
jgi:phage terminase small subunit